MSRSILDVLYLTYKYVGEKNNTLCNGKKPILKGLNPEPLGILQLSLHTVIPTI